MLDKTIIPQQTAAGQQPQEIDNLIHPRACLCPDCLFLPRVKDAEFYVHWVENRLAKSTPRWYEHWQQQLNYAWQSLNYWQRQYEADKARLGGAK